MSKFITLLLLLSITDVASANRASRMRVNTPRSVRAFAQSRFLRPAHRVDRQRNQQRIQHFNRFQKLRVLDARRTDAHRDQSVSVTTDKGTFTLRRWAEPGQFAKTTLMIAAPGQAPRRVLDWEAKGLRMGLHEMLHPNYALEPVKPAGMSSKAFKGLVSFHRSLEGYTEIIHDFQ